jgi:hypothetical protein
MKTARPYQDVGRSQTRLRLSARTQSSAVPLVELSNVRQNTGNTSVTPDRSRKPSLIIRTLDVNAFQHSSVFLAHTTDMSVSFMS